MIKRNKRVISVILSILLLSFLLIYSGINNTTNNTTNNTNKINITEQLGNIPRTKKKIKNIIYMIGDGMGENHIMAGALYKGEELNIQGIKNKSYVITSSTEEITDSAAAATALATGFKTNNGVIGKDKFGNNLENLIEYTNKKGMKTGIVCTQILNHATPAAFLVHNQSRHNYYEIALSQIESCVDLMLGGGRQYFSKYQSKMLENSFEWINNLSELENINKENKVIGTFASASISEEKDRVSLKELTQEAIYRLDNENGFFLMIEGSDIDSYSHQLNMEKTLNEIIDFDEAVKIAKEYVDINPDTLLIVTADHETGGLNLDGITIPQQLTDSLFTSNNHTSKNVLMYAYGIAAEDLTQYNLIDNTSICNFIKQGLKNAYEK